jgi:hypothetical protein
MITQDGNVIVFNPAGDTIVAPRRVLGKFEGYPADVDSPPYKVDVEHVPSHDCWQARVREMYGRRWNWVGGDTMDEAIDAALLRAGIDPDDRHLYVAKQRPDALRLDVVEKVA